MVQKQALKLIHYNIQCITNKINSLEFLLDRCDPTFVCISEHWATTTQIEQVELTGYTRISNYSRQTHIHGGTAIFVKDHIMHKCKNLKNLCDMSIELSFECSAMTYNNNTCIVCIYRSPNSDVNIFFTQLSALLSKITNNYGSLFVCGDFNIDNMVPSFNSAVLTDIVESYDLNSLFNHATRIYNQRTYTSQTSLDYILTNVNNDNVICNNFDPGLSDHYAQLINWEINTTNINHEQAITKTFRKINGLSIAEFVKFFCGDQLFLTNLHGSTDDINSIFSIFYEHFSWCFQTAFPKITKTVSGKHENKIKFGPETLKKVQDLKDLNYLKKQINCEYLNVKYKQSKRDVENCIRAEKQRYYKDKIKNSNNQTRSLWKIIKENTNPGKKANSGISLLINNETITDTSKIVDHFGECFSNIIEDKLSDHFDGVLSKTCTYTEHTAHSFFCTPVTENDVQKVIAALPNKKSTGYDEVSVDLVKKCSNILSGPIAYIINKSIQLGQFPQLLKLALLIPIPKDGDPQNVENYRPIAILSIFSKIIETVIAQKINDYLNKFNVITDSQHGFRKNRSTETATLEFVQHIHNKIDHNEITTGIFFDLSRAFDTLNIQFVSEKLERMGIRGNTNALLTSYLANRRFMVKHGDTTSREYTINRGTPQGSVLGPLIFLLYVNDLPQHITGGKTFIYADDTSIITSGKCAEEVQHKIINIIKQFSEWCAKNQLIINLKKTVLINFYNRIDKSTNSHPVVQNITLTPASSIKFLGTIVDSQLNWNLHIDFTAKKLNKVYYIIKNLKNKLDTDSIMSVYYANFHSVISYNIAVWGRSSDINRILILQKRVIRMIFNLETHTSCRTTFCGNKILTVTSIYLLKILLHIHGKKTTLAKHSNIHTINTRGKNDIYQNKHIHAKYEKSPLYSGTHLYNLLPLDLKCLPFLKFKRKLKEYLSSNCFYTIDEFIQAINGTSTLSH